MKIWEAVPGNKPLDGIKRLIESGADLDAKDGAGWTALMVACWNGYTETVKLLISKGANIEAKDNTGWTALMVACWSGHTETAKLLLSQYKTDESLKALILTLPTDSKAYPFAIGELKRRYCGTMESC